MTTGDQIGNFAMPDLGKTQQLPVTILPIGVYVAMIWRAFAGQSSVRQLPPSDRSFIWMIGVGHAPHLAYKAAPHRREALKKPTGGGLGLSK